MPRLSHALPKRRVQQEGEEALPNSYANIIMLKKKGLTQGTHALAPHGQHVINPRLQPYR